MALVERVVGELLDDVEQLLAQRPSVARGIAAAHEAGPFLLHELADLLAAGLPQVVSVGQRIAGELLRHPHDRLLVDHQAVGVGQELLGVVVEVLDLLPAVLAICVVVVHVGRHRPGSVQGDQGGHVLEAGRGQGAHEGPHRAGLQLEHPDGVTTGQHLEGGPVVQVHSVNVDHLSPAALHVDQRVGDHVKVPQAQEVHLEKAQVLDAVHLVLGDDGCVLGVLTRLRLALDRHVLGERLAGDHHRCRVDPVLASEPLQTPCDVDNSADVVVAGVHVAQVGCHLEAVGVLLGLREARCQRSVPPQDQRRHGLGDAVAHHIRVAQHPGGVTDRGPGLDLGEGHDLGDVVPAVLLGGIPDHLVSEPGVEVHVDVGHRDPARVQEAFEEQVVADRIQVGDPEAVGHSTPGGASPPRADPDVLLAGVSDQVPGDEEVGGEPHVADRPQFVDQAFHHPILELVSPPPPCALEGEVLQVGVGTVESLRDGEVRQPGLAELDLHVAPFGDPERVVAGIR